VERKGEGEDKKQGNVQGKGKRKGKEIERKMTPAWPKIPSK